MVAGVGVAVAAPALINGIFGHRWHDSIVPLQALALYAAFRSLGVGAVDVYKAMGRPGIAVWLSVVRFVVLVPTLIFATHWGINGVAIAQAIVALVFAIAMQGLAARVLGLRLSELRDAVAPAVIAGIALAVTGVLVARLGPSEVLLRLALHLVVGAITALVALRITAPTLLGNVRGLLASRAAPAA
jgi:PST family polysaccharide transporter